MWPVMDFFFQDFLFTQFEHTYNLGRPDSNLSDLCTFLLLLGLPQNSAQAHGRRGEVCFPIPHTLVLARCFSRSLEVLFECYNF